MHYRSVTASHPAFPIFMTALGAMPALSNGAQVDLWGSPDPISICVLNINHSQTRKSRVTSMSENMVAGVDKVWRLR